MNKLIFKKKYYYKKVFFFKNFLKKKYNKKIKPILKKVKKKDFNLKKKIIIFGQKKTNIKFCVFAGREKNINILHFYVKLLLDNNIIDEYHIFNFTRNIKDHLFLNEEYKKLNKIYKNKIYIHNNEIKNFDKSLKNDWSPFYNTIYKISNENDVIIKCDDDILFIDIFSLKNAIKDRINDKFSFLIHSNCINNGVCTYYQKHLYNKKLTEQLNKYPTGGILGILFEKPEIGYVIHNQFYNDILTNINNLNNYKIEDIYIASRISINFILINGKDLKYIKNVSTDDEYKLSSFIPEKLLRPNKIKGDLITSHYSYSFQEKVMFYNDNILNSYNKIKDKYKFTNNIITNYNLNKSCELTCSLETCNLKNCSLETCNLKNCSLETYSLETCNLKNCSLETCSLETCNLKNGNLKTCNLKNCNLKNNIFKIKNWFNETHYYIKNIESNLYLSIEYYNNEAKLSPINKTIFEIENIESDIIQIKLGIYYLTRYNINGEFRNENILLKYLKDESERFIIKENSQDGFYLKFKKYNCYLSSNKENNIIITNDCKSKWIFEKVNITDEYLNCTRFIKSDKFYYKNLSNNEIYTNHFLGWGVDNLLS
jgi:hypothetical protein